MVAIPNPDPIAIRTAKRLASTRKTRGPREREGWGSRAEPEGTFAISLDQSVQARPSSEGVALNDIVWRPSEDYVEGANVTRFMRANGIATYDELVKRSQDDVEWFWDAVVKDLGIEFYRPYQQVLDQSKGVPWATWFGGGSINL